MNMERRFTVKILVFLFALIIGITLWGILHYHKINVIPRETPVVLQATEQNKGQRCEATNYPLPEPDGEEESIPNYRECYKLQERLFNASRDGNLSEIREALKYGAHPEGTFYQSYPALQVAAVNGHTDAVLLLLDNGADVNRVVSFQSTALNSAASAGHIDVVKVLLERGANVCYKSSAGTAEDIARKRGYKEIAELLLKAYSPASCK